MVNTDDFIKRLEIIFDYYSVNASGFADKIGVQRSSLSHLLSGRNKPSLDFILKIIEVFPDVDLYWILNPVLETKIEKTADLFSEKIAEPKIKVEENFINTITNSDGVSIQKNSSEIDRIVFFYKNGTFRTYSSE
jgi:DNA-binding XRE family transcriptional regulator